MAPGPPLILAADVSLGATPIAEKAAAMIKGAARQSLAA